MQEINIKLWRHNEEKDWSVEVSAKLHKHVSTKTLAKYVLAAAQQALLEPEIPPVSGATPDDLPMGIRLLSRSAEKPRAARVPQSQS